jgi:glutathione S-transferase
MIRRMITLHHLENSRSQRVLWLLEELGLPYRVQRYARDAKTQLAPPELLAVHPLGKSPVISDGDVTVAESGAIVEYLLDTYGQGRLRPAAGSAQHRQFIYWLHFAEGSAMPLLVMKLVFDKVRAAPVPFFVKPIVKAIADKVTGSFIAPNLKRQLVFMESEMARQAWFAGDEFTAADVQMSFVLEAAASRAADGASFASTYPHLADLLKRFHARPAYQRALASGGPFSILS